MQKKFVSLSGFAIALLLIAGATFFIFGRTKPTGSRLANPKTRLSTLSKLIKKNSIKDLPKAFSYRKEEDSVDYFAAADKEGNIFHVVRVTYGFGGSQHRIYSFVFDSNGECVLRSKQNKHFSHGGLFDFTGDGTIEKILTFDVGESNGEIAKNTPYDSTLQVWRLQTPSPYILLDVRFEFFPDEEDDPNDFTNAVIGYADGKAQRIELVGRGFKPRVSFSWSKAKKQFVCSGPLESKYWKVLFPVPELPLEK